MKIVCISDTHRQHAPLLMPEGDIVIHAGDISGMGREQEIREFLFWFSRLDYKHKIFIAGNHDFYFDQHRLLANELLNQYPEITYLENSSVEIEGIKIYGSPITPTFYDWAFMCDRGEKIKRYWDMIPKDADVLITHGPPYGILDKTPMTEDHVGCEELLKTLAEIRPLFHIFGHIHDGAGIHKTEHTTFINASVLDDNYKLKYKPITITI